jgi:hypothetical protein
MGGRGADARENGPKCVEWLSAADGEGRLEGAPGGAGGGS